MQGRRRKGNSRHADHPFFYTIAESTTSTILFAGVFCGE